MHWISIISSSHDWFFTSCSIVVLNKQQQCYSSEQLILVLYKKKSMKLFTLTKDNSRRPLKDKSDGVPCESNSQASTIWLFRQSRTRDCQFWDHNCRKLPANIQWQRSIEPIKMCLKGWRMKAIQPRRARMNVSICQCRKKRYKAQHLHQGMGLIKYKSKFYLRTGKVRYKYPWTRRTTKFYCKMFQLKAI